jgi:hypothetical protein
MTAEAVLQCLRHVWLALTPLQFPMAVVGGLALARWKYIRATRDIDLLVGVKPAGHETLLDHLERPGVRPKRDPPITDLGELAVVQLLYEPPGAFIDLQIDLLLADSEYHRTALRPRIPTRLPDLDLEVAVLRCEDLILHKLLAGRLIDRVDAANLLRANRDALDEGYLATWS